MGQSSDMVPAGQHLLNGCSASVPGRSGDQKCLPTHAWLPPEYLIFALFISHIDYCRHLMIDDVNNLNVNPGIAVIQKNLKEKIETMRKSKSEAAQTRRHILTTASQEFRRNGVNGTGLADLMSAAGLTHGGFYRHFKNKEHLAAEALTSALDARA